MCPTGPVVVSWTSCPFPGMTNIFVTEFAEVHCGNFGKIQMMT